MTYSVCALESAPRVPFKFDGRILFSSGRFELVHLTLQPGEGMDLHTQPIDIVFFVIEGSGTLAIEEEILRMNQYSTKNLDYVNIKRNNDG